MRIGRALSISDGCARCLEEPTVFMVLGRGCRVLEVAERDRGKKRGGALRRLSAFIGQKTGTILGLELVLGSKLGKTTTPFFFAHSTQPHRFQFQSSF
jgi:hypothetical protein